MADLLHSENDSSSSEEAPPDVKLASPPEEKVPMSTSIIFEKAKVSLDAPAEKITVRFLAIGSTPLIRPLKFVVAGTQTIGTISTFLMKKLRLRSVHIYVLNLFQPTPDEKLGDLHQLFHTNGELLLGYCETMAFG